ncbi:MAG: hypothetical protein ACE5JD_00260 [Candidatus Methylomirabilia bacterium]
MELGSRRVTDEVGGSVGTRGFTLLGLLVLLALAATGAALALPLVLDITVSNEEATRRKLAKLVEVIAGIPGEATFGFIGDVGRVPKSLEELNNLQGPHTLCDSSFNPSTALFDTANRGGLGMGWQGPYFKEMIFTNEHLEDGWGNRFRYTCPEVTVPSTDPTSGGVSLTVRIGQITSAGPDGLFDTGDDISSEPFQDAGHLFLTVTVGRSKNPAKNVTATLFFPEDGQQVSLVSQPTTVVGPDGSEVTIVFDSVPAGVRFAEIEFGGRPLTEALHVALKSNIVNRLDVKIPVGLIAFNVTDAILVNGDLKIDDRATINGQCGNVHANGDLKIRDRVSIAGDATASGKFSASKKVDIGGPGVGGGFDPKDIPAIDPADFLTAAKVDLPVGQVFHLKSNGEVFDGDDPPKHLATLHKGQKFQGWKYRPGHPAKWTFSGKTAVDGTYFFEGDAKISGRAGSGALSWRVTVLATGDIKVSGRPTMTAHLTDTLLVAGDEIKISSSKPLTGLVAAHGRIRISGRPTITGVVLAENASSSGGHGKGHDDDDDDDHKKGKKPKKPKPNRISGRPTITFSCVLNPPLQP